MDERRRRQRVRTTLDVRWEGLFTQGKGTIADMGPRGCFVLTGGDLQPGELIRLEITYPNEEVAAHWGEIVYIYPEIGFAVHFSFSTREQESEYARLFASLNK